MLNRRDVIGLRAVCAAALLGVPGAMCFGQSETRAVFVSNNGNLEGSITSFRLEEDDTLTFVNRVITGSTPSTSMPVPGTNAAVISISPNGRFLAVGHQTGLEVVEQVTILEVASDGTIAIFDTFSTPDSPLDLQWVTDEYLAVTHTDLSVTNEVIMYEFDPKGPTVTEIDSEFTGSFTTALALHPSGSYLYAQDSFGFSVSAFEVNGDGTLTHIETQSTGTTYPLGIGVSANGNWLYGGGGISGNDQQIVGLSIDQADGSLAPITGSPFMSPGDSPKQIVTTPDSTYALVAHGGDGTVRTFAIDRRTGVLTPTGFLVSLGLGISLGEVTTLDDLAFVADRDTIDDPRGVRVYRVNADGSLILVEPIVDTEGIAPNSIAVWAPPADDVCLGDFVSSKTFQPPPDGLVDGADLAFLLGEWGANPGSAADIVSSDTFMPPPDGVVDGADLAVLLGAWGVCE